MTVDNASLLVLIGAAVALVGLVFFARLAIAAIFGWLGL
jgi:hypothetical protein